MTVDERLDALRELIQRDVGNRGLRTDPADNLITRTAGDFAAACHGIAASPSPAVCVVTGFYIPHAQPPASETDGPLGAVFLARALVSLGIKTAIFTGASTEAAIKAGLGACGLLESVPLKTIPPTEKPRWDVWLAVDWYGFRSYCALTHLIALERVGPCRADGSCRTMRGLDISADTEPAHLLFEDAFRHSPPMTTIGIGDGGNEIGMGKLPWDTIRRNIPNGDRIACRVPTDHLIVAGVSNWGAYALAAGVLLLRDEKGDASLFDPDRERKLLQVMVERGQLVDGVTGRPTATVDGLSWETYAEPLAAMGRLLH
jgi:hypothetical protein